MMESWDKTPVSYSSVQKWYEWEQKHANIHWLSRVWCAVSHSLWLHWPPLMTKTELNNLNLTQPDQFAVYGTFFPTQLLPEPRSWVQKAPQKNTKVQYFFSQGDLTFAEYINSGIFILLTLAGLGPLIFKKKTAQMMTRKRGGEP